MTAVEEITALQEGKLGKGLKQFLSDEVVGKGKGKETLAVFDAKLGTLNPYLVPGKNSARDFFQARALQKSSKYR